jgi:hypothetical protein
MSKSSMCILSLAVVAVSVGATLARAQDATMGDAISEYREWMEVIADFTKGVEFDEGDIQEVLQYWPEMEGLAVMQNDDSEGDAADFAKDVRKILSDSEYQQWARGNGLDPERFLRRSMRIAMVFLVQQMEEQKGMLASQRESFETMVEQSCAQVDAETCAQMRRSMEQTIAISEAMITATEKLPPPTPSELALIERYGEDLEAVMTPEDEEFDEYYSDYEDYDDDYDEDGG